MALTVVTWSWGGKYGDHYVRRLYNGVRRNLDQAHRFICIVDRPLQLPPAIVQYGVLNTDLLSKPGCFARLRLFDPNWQRNLGIAEGDKILNLDLDLVVTGKLDPLLDRDDGFSILQGINTTNPAPYNGSVWMLRAGYRPDVWTPNILEAYAAENVAVHSFPDDQGWMHHKMPDAGVYGPDQGVFGFKKKFWPSGDALPPNAKIVAFPGWRSPEKFEHLKWVADNWK